MKYRKRRIIWSLLWGIAAALLIVIWVRSYSSMQLWHFSRTHAAMAVDGLFMFDGAWVKSNRIAPSNPSGYIETWDHDPHYEYDRVGGLDIECWVSVVVAIAIGIVPWLRWRFSLRTLLIITALVAVALGVAMWMHSQGRPIMRA